MTLEDLCANAACIPSISIHDKRDVARNRACPESRDDYPFNVDEEDRIDDM